MSVTESVAGSVNYGIVCTGAPPAANTTAKVEFTADSVTVTASSGGGKSGGGGAIPAAERPNVLSYVTGVDPKNVGGKGGNRTLDPGIMSRHIGLNGQ
jgi:hypothetical protein